MRGLILGLALLSIVTGVASADGDSALRRALAIDSVSDLAAVCRGIAELAGGEDDPEEAYRLLSCISYVRGAQALYASYQKAFGTRTFCPPAGTTLGDQIGTFLAWTEANRDRGGENAGQGFIVALVQGFPCAEASR